MIIRNRSKAWGKEKIKVHRLSGLIIAYGGLKYGHPYAKTLVDDYLEDFFALRIPALLNNKTGKNIEDLYDDFVSENWIWPIDHYEFRDVADYILHGLQIERDNRSILTWWEPEEVRDELYLCA